MGFKLNLNDGRRKVLAHMHKTHIFTHDPTHTNSQSNPRESVSHLLSLRVDRPTIVLTDLKNTLFTDPISEGSGCKSGTMFHLLRQNAGRGTLTQFSASHYQPATTPHDHNNRAANLSVSAEQSPGEQQRSEKQTRVYRCSQITSYL